MVSRKLPLSALSARDVIPAEAYGFQTDVIEVGRLIIHSAHTEKYRPCPGGISIGHYKVTAGTLGCYVRKSGTLYILSNNHILANQNDANPGDPIIQPGFYDGGTERDMIARLIKFVPLQFTENPPDCGTSERIASILSRIAKMLGSSHSFKTIKLSEATNLVDAAIAMMDQSLVDESILEIGEVRHTKYPELGMKVIKSGRSTGYTEGEIIVLDATVTVEYDAGRSAIFERQIVTGPMSAPGDSGSILVNQSDGINYAIGLLFGGSDKVTLYNPIELVLSALEVEI
jgi:hypothetical protein